MVMLGIQPIVRPLTLLLLGVSGLDAAFAAEDTQHDQTSEAPDTDAPPDEKPAVHAVGSVAAGALAAGTAIWILQQSGSDSDDESQGVAPHEPHSGEGARVAVIDSDFRISHRELKPHAERYQRFYNPGDRDWDVTEEDAQNHGTRVASITAGTEQGVAPEADLHLYADGLGTGAWSRESFDAAVSAAEAEDIRILNLSAVYFDLSDAIPERLREFTANDRLLVIAAGNEGADGPIGDVAGAIDTFKDRAIAVGALDEDDRLWEHSNRAGSEPAAQARFLTAPGVRIESADSSGDDDYSRASGTSFSSPKVAGAAALILSEWEHLAAEEIAEILLETADRDFDEYDPSHYGQGRLDIEAALEPQGTLQIPLKEGESAPAATTTLTGNDATVQALLDNNALAGGILTDRFNRDFPADLSAAVGHATAPQGLNQRMAHALSPLTPSRQQTEEYAFGRLVLRAEGTQPPPSLNAPSSLRITLAAPAGRLMLEQHNLATAGALLPESLAFEPRAWLHTDPELDAHTHLQRLTAQGTLAPWLDVQAQVLLAGGEDGLLPHREREDGLRKADERTVGYHTGVRLKRGRLGLEIAHTVYQHEGHGAELRGDGGFAVDGATHQRSTISLRWQATNATDLLLEHRHTHRKAANLGSLLQSADLREQITRLGLEHRRDAERLGLAIGHRRHLGGHLTLRLPTGIEADGSLRHESRTVDIPTTETIVADAFWRFPLLGGDAHLSAFKDHQEQGGTLAWAVAF